MKESRNDWQYIWFDEVSCIDYFTLPYEAYPIVELDMGASTIAATVHFYNYTTGKLDRFSISNAGNKHIRFSMQEDDCRF